MHLEQSQKEIDQQTSTAQSDSWPYYNRYGRIRPHTEGIQTITITTEPPTTTTKVTKPQASPAVIKAMEEINIETRAIITVEDV